MTKNTNANTNDPGSQRKRSANQPRANVASQNNQQSQQNSKKGNKQQNQQNQSQNQSAVKSTPSAAAATSTTPAAPATSLPALPTTPTIVLPDESYVPLAGFNGDDIDRLLKNGFDEKAPIYKSEQPAAQQKTSPWGQKPGSMSNGKDFWLELRKQVTSLQKGESANKGG